MESYFEICSVCKTSKIKLTMMKVLKIIQFKNVKSRFPNSLSSNILHIKQNEIIKYLIILIEESNYIRNLEGKYSE